MSAGTITINRATDNSIKLHFTVTDAGTGVKTDRDITGCTVFFTVKKRLSDLDADAVLNKTISSHSDPTHGITYVPISHSDSLLDAHGYKYDLKLIDSSANRISSGVGTFDIEAVVRDGA